MDKEHNPKCSECIGLKLPDPEHKVCRRCNGVNFISRDIVKGKGE